MDKSIGRLAAGILMAGMVAPAWADGLVKVEQTVFGMDCAPCAYGAQKNLSKLPGVTKVEVSMNDGKAVIEFSPGSATTLAQIREVLIHGGLTPKAALVTVEGHIAKQGNKLQLIAGPAEQFDLLPSQANDPASLAADAKVTVQGEVAESDPDAIPILSIQSITPAN
jgi:copper chaperone CopZ